MRSALAVSPFHSDRVHRRAWTKVSSIIAVLCVMAMVPLLARPWLSTASSEWHFARRYDPPIIPYRVNDANLAEEARSASQLCTSSSEEVALVKLLREDVVPPPPKVSHVSADEVLKRIRPWRQAKKRQPRLLCIITVMAETPQTAAAAHRYWAHRCDHHYIVWNVTIPTVRNENVLLRNIHGGYKFSNTYQPVLLILHELATNASLRAEDYDFVVMVQDNAFVVVENLRRMLMEPWVQRLQDAGTPLLLGRRLVGTENVFLSFMTFVVNIATLRVLSVIAAMDDCKPFHVGYAGDLALGHCATFFGLSMLNAIDVYGEDRVHFFHTQAIMAEKGGWVKEYRKGALPDGFSAVSPYTCSIPEPFEELHSMVYGKSAPK